MILIANKEEAVAKSKFFEVFESSIIKIQMEASASDLSPVLDDTPAMQELDKILAEYNKSKPNP